MEVLRPPTWQRLVCSAVPAAVAVLVVVGGVADGAGVVLAACGTAAVLLLGAAARTWLLRVEVRADGIALVNWTGTVQVPWSEVERCGYDVGTGLWVRRRSGRQHAAAAFSWVVGALPGVERRGRAAGERLESLRRRRSRSASRG